MLKAIALNDPLLIGSALNPDMFMKSTVINSSIFGLLSLCLTASLGAAPDPYEINKLLGRGVNMGNALDAPTEGEWGLVLEEEHFEAAKQAGFDSIRLPVRWSAHASMEAPYTIDPEFFERVDWAIEQGLKRDMPVLLDLHHYRETYADPHPHKERYLGLWKQIAPHYKDYPDTLLFEPMNEPDEALTPEIWNDWLVDALAIIRVSNPDRTVVIGPGEDNTVAFLKDLKLPEDDRNIIVTIHFYHPLSFTHQGAEWFTWVDASEWLGNQWRAEGEQARLVDEEFDIALAWGKEHDRPLHLGEFGSIKLADMDSRAAWTAYVAEAAVSRGMSFHYWEFCADWFMVYDRQSKTYNEPLMKALLPDWESAP